MGYFHIKFPPHQRYFLMMKTNNMDYFHIIFPPYQRYLILLK